MYVNPVKLRSNVELRAAAREQLKGNWGKAILISLLYALIIFVLNSIPMIGPILLLLVAGALMIGLSSFFIRMKRGQRAEVGELFNGFSQFATALGVYLVTFIFVFLWSLLLIIPGIIAALRYSMVYFIMIDNPNIGVMDAIRQSSAFMMGQKGKLFLLLLSFIGWAILSVITFGIGFLWLMPYMTATLAHFYDDVKNAAV